MLHDVTATTSQFTSLSWHYLTHGCGVGLLLHSVTVLLQCNIVLHVTAHTSQFSSPGWHYLRHGYGVGQLDKGGSIVSLVSPDASQLTVVIETMVSKTSLRPTALSCHRNYGEKKRHRYLQLSVVIETLVSKTSLIPTAQRCHRNYGE